MWDNFVIVMQEAWANKRKVFFGVIVVIALVLFLIARVGGWINSIKVSYDLQKETRYVWLTGSCTVNQGTKDKPDYVYCHRLLGTVSSQVEDGTNGQ
jgi:hypothetical protein